MVRERSSFCSVVLPPIVSVVGAVTVAAPRSKVPAPVRDSVEPVISKVPLATVVAAGMVIVPPVLVSWPLVRFSPDVNVRLLVPVIIRRLTAFMVTGLATVTSDPSVRMASAEKFNDDRLIGAALVRVAVTDTFITVGAVKVLPVVFRLPLRTNVLLLKFRVPPLAIPEIQI